MTKVRKRKSIDFLKEDIGIDVQMVSPKVWGAQIMHGRFQRIETDKGNEYYVTIHVKGELRLEDLIPVKSKGFSVNDGINAMVGGKNANCTRHPNDLG